MPERAWRVGSNPKFWIGRFRIADRLADREQVALQFDMVRRCLLYTSLHIRNHTGDTSAGRLSYVLIILVDLLGRNEDRALSAI